MLRFLFAVAALAAPFSGCDGGPTLEELNRVSAVRDPSVDDTPPDAPFRPGQRRDVGDADATIEPVEANEFMRAVTMPGDLDGDGIGDLVVWGELPSPPEIVPCHMGCPGFSQLLIRVIYGSTTLGAGGALRADAEVRSWYVNGLRPSVDAAGDVNGDGFADLVVGVGTEIEGVQGNAYVILGGERLRGDNDVRDVGVHLRENGSTHFDQAAGLGDVDGDGLADFAVGATEWPRADDPRGRLYVYYGSGDAPERRSEDDASAAITSEGATRFGIAQAVGDVNGDGRGDFSIGEQDGAVTRVMWLVLGRAERFSGDIDVASVGTRIVASAVRGLGDLDGDGTDDLGITADEGARDGFVLWGRAEWPDAIEPTDADTWIERGEDTRASPIAARQMLPAGDVDGDGHADFFYADPHYSPDGAARGAAYLFRGALARASGGHGLSEATAFLGQDWHDANEPGRRRGYDSIGRSIASGSDVNGDGIEDLVLAAAQAPDGGRGYLWLGRRDE
ncbi:RTX toxin [Sandaracinus amylolyticus]|uniref:RTX toxin n=2 Tax=Sandaracinus amylolyticus TaxID=927083 RepID=A0A0F6SHR9_9BACT|nr:RTX toxin [Sandaracinus amylolyticus]